MVEIVVAILIALCIWHVVLPILVGFFAAWANAPRGRSRQTTEQRSNWDEWSEQEKEQWHIQLRERAKALEKRARAELGDEECDRRIALVKEKYRLENEPRWAKRAEEYQRARRERRAKEVEVRRLKRERAKARLERIRASRRCDGSNSAND